MFGFSNSKEKRSLYVVLIVPYIALVFLLALILGILSYRSGKSATLSIAQHLLRETTRHINQTIKQNIGRTVTTLDTAVLEAKTASLSMQNYDTLIPRFWSAASLHASFNDNVFYGTTSGLFLGLHRSSDALVDIYLKTNPDEKRKIFTQKAPDGELFFSSFEKKSYDPRERPWFQAALLSHQDVWTAVYIDFVFEDLVITRSRPVLNSQDEVQGVVATDFALKRLSDYISALEISPNSIAFIIERDGNIIASSCCPNLKRLANGTLGRIHATDSGNLLVGEVYEQVRMKTEQKESALFTEPFHFLNSAKDRIYVSCSLFEDPADLQWISIVAVPENDFMGGINRNALQTFFLTLAATIAVAIIGFFILHRVLRDVKILSDAVSQVGSGALEKPITIRRRDEIGDLAQSFHAMQQRLQTDYLTKLPNRYALEQKLELLIQSSQPGDAPCQFALFFIDVNDFKKINDQHGHDAGDAVLVEIAKRMRARIRQSDTLARFAGDEYVLLLDCIEMKETLVRIKNKLIEALSRPVETADGYIHLYGGSFGIACYPEDGKTGHELLLVADQRMYKHKQEQKKSKLL